MFQFNKRYLLFTTILFLTEVLIGAYMHDAVIRPYGGDFLVVILLYCMVKTCINTPPLITACSVLLFAYLVEISQYFHLVQMLGWEHFKTARIVMGTSFSFIDLLTYTFGILFVIIIENRYTTTRACNYAVS